MTIKYKKEPRTIALKGTYILKEEKSFNSIKPGHIVEIIGTTVTAAKGVEKFVKVQDTIGANCQRSIALENDLLGKGIGLATSPRDDTDQYVSGENVRYAVFKAGCEILGRFETPAAAVNTKITYGTPLMAKGNGSFTIWAHKIVLGDAVTSTNENAVIGFSLEDHTIAGASIEMFLKMEIL